MAQMSKNNDHSELCLVVPRQVFASYSRALISSVSVVPSDTLVDSG